LIVHGSKLNSKRTNNRNSVLHFLLKDQSSFLKCFGLAVFQIRVISASNSCFHCVWWSL